MSAPEPVRVLFVCTENAARSQMAEGLLRAWGGDRYAAFSAGTTPQTVHPVAQAVMHEVGINLRLHRSESIDAYQERTLDYVVTLCEATRDLSPSLRAQEMVIHQPFADPTAQDGDPVVAFRTVRDALAAWIAAVFDVRPPGASSVQAEGRPHPEPAPAVPPNPV